MKTRRIFLASVVISVLVLTITSVAGSSTKVLAVSIPAQVQDATNAASPLTAGTSSNGLNSLNTLNTLNALASSFNSVPTQAHIPAQVQDATNAAGHNTLGSRSSADLASVLGGFINNLPANFPRSLQF